MIFYYNTNAPDFGIRFKLRFDMLGRGRDIVFLCIGTDKITGDSLGPYTGTLLKQRGLCVYGTLGSTVNATNLIYSTARIYREHRRPFIVAIDACLGKKEHIGFVTLAKGALRAGEGVSKKLMPVGDIAIKGIVGEAGKDSLENLMRIPENEITRMGKIIAEALTL